MTHRIIGIAETALYVDDLGRAAAFYIDLFDCPVARQDARLCALRVGPEQILLLFPRGCCTEPLRLPGGVIPPHDGSGPLHVCFGIPADQVSLWEQRLTNRAIPIESRFQWPSGGISLYFRDPDGHAVELATPGIWND